MNFIPAYEDLKQEGERFQPFVEPVKKMRNFFWKTISWILWKGFQAFWEKKLPENKFSGFFWNTIQAKQTPQTWFQESVPVKKFQDKLESNLNPKVFQKADFKLSSSSITLSDHARFYAFDGTYIDTLSKNTKILASVSREVWYQDGKAFIYIDGHNSTSNRIGAFESWYLRAVWLDSYILAEKEQKEKWRTKEIQSYIPNISVEYKKNISFSQSIPSVQYKANRKNIFSWYMGPNGEEIPDYIIKAVTINYFWKIIKPKIENNIKQTDAEIAKTREILIKKRLTSWTPQNHDLQLQKQKISKKHKLRALSKAIEEAYSGNQTSFDNPDLQKIILSMQQKPEWQDIILKSYTVKKNMKKWKK